MRGEVQECDLGFPVTRHAGPGWQVIRDRVVERRLAALDRDRE
jgi:hypothetical protein